MCKVLIMPKVNGPKAIEFIKRMGTAMSPGNRDGLGYAAIDSDGKLFGQRWLYNDEAFKSQDEVPIVRDPLDFMEDAVHSYVSKSQLGLSGCTSSFGDDVNINNAVAITMHTRMATSDKGLKNTHPFVSGDTSLIHNGVIRNDNEFDLKLSTCDSEAILIAYLQQKVNIMPDNATKMASMLAGYYACGVFSRDNDGRRILDVFKGNSATLSVCYIKELDAIVYATSDHDVRTVASSMGLTVSDSFHLKEGVLIRFDPVGHEYISKHKFTVGVSYLSTYNSSNNRSNIHDVSIQGWKDKKKKTTYSEEMLDMMRSFPSIKELSRAEVNEIAQSYQSFKREA